MLSLNLIDNDNEIMYSKVIVGHFRCYPEKKNQTEKWWLILHLAFLAFCFLIFSRPKISSCLRWLSTKVTFTQIVFFCYSSLHRKKYRLVFLFVRIRETTEVNEATISSIKVSSIKKFQHWKRKQTLYFEKEF